ncbi:MAG: class I SAM-dependent DNA methyltransferase, partial [Chloroflexi bacterium]|nr:class I SAM-dependent DNA methyltransferase [Chloroflexota bacterium]
MSNARFRDIFDTFDLFNFTVREDEPLEKEVAVDPEMLGKVFENLLEVTDRKSKGAFYTPREIVHYMCQESLINYLDTNLNASHSVGEQEPLIPPNAKQPKLFGDPDPEQLSLTATETRATIPHEDISALIRQGEFGLEHDAAKAGGTKSYRYQLPQSIRDNAAALDAALANIKICDPAIGSGAFPVGLMQEVVKARTVLTTY